MNGVLGAASAAIVAAEEDYGLVPLEANACGRPAIAYGAGGKELAQYPSTIGDSHDPLPIGHWAVVGIVHYPWFDWDPKMLWGVNKTAP